MSFDIRVCCSVALLALGCGHHSTAAAAGSGTNTITFISGGVTRTVLVHPPSTKGGAMALVLNMHGTGSTAAGQEGFSGMDAAADAEGFVVAYPEGAIVSGTGFDWNVPGEPLFGGGAVPPGAADDVAFLANAITTIEGELSIDPKRVYATGFSGGARMASQLGCDLSTTIAAIGPVSGLRLPSPCNGTRPMPVLSFHGTADPIDPYDGNGQAYWTYSVPSAEAQWAVEDSCGSSPTTSQPVTGVTLSEYAGCSQGALVDLYTLTGEGHEWPGGPTLPAAVTNELGPQSNLVDANTVLWTFFSAHPMP